MKPDFNYIENTTLQLRHTDVCVMKQDFNHIENTTLNECNQNATRPTALSRERITKKSGWQYCHPGCDYFLCITKIE